MLIIPVIDLFAGNVVHATAGNREAYANIKTPLCHGSNPMDVINALMRLYAFTHIYIADLNAIKNEDNNNELINELISHYPDICFWLDAGKQDISSNFPVNQLRHVTGSETGITYQQLIDKPDFAESILSLDFINNKFLGDPSLMENGNDWPKDIIVMSLDRVGTNQGPDSARLAQIQALSGDKRIFAAGGVRSEADLQTLSTQNIAGALIATALHHGKISREALQAYSSI